MQNRYSPIKIENCTLKLTNETTDTILEYLKNMFLNLWLRKKDFNKVINYLFIKN